MNHSRDYRDSRWDRNMSHERSSSDQGRGPHLVDPRAPSGERFEEVRHMSEPGSHDKSPLNENHHWSREAEAHHRRAMSDARWPASAQDEWSPMPYAMRPMPRYKEFVGKGPKGYSRSDALILEDVSQRLSHGYLDASEIEVTVKDGEVTLQGLVRSKHDRRLAEDLVEECFGVRDVDNRLRVPRSRVSQSDDGMAASASQDSRESSSSTSGRRLPS